MAFPSVVQSRVTTDKSKSVNVSYPSGMTSGNRVIFAIGWVDDAAPVSYSGSALTYIGGIDNDENNRANVYAYYRDIDGTEGSSENFDFDQDRECTAIVVEVSGQDTAVAPLGAFATTGGGRTNNPDPPSRAWGWSGDTLALAGFVFREDATVTGQPSGYSQINSGNISGKALHVISEKDVTSSPENPSTFSVDDTRNATTYTLVIKAAGGAAAQTVTGAGFDNPNTFGTGAVTTGAVTITGSGFDNPNTFGTGAITQPSASQTVTGAGFDNPNAFGTGVFTAGAATITGAGFDNPNTFGTGAVTAGAATITGAGFDNPNTFGTGAVTTGAATITGAGFDNPNAFGTGAVTTGAATITGAGFDNPNTFGTGAVTAGAATITGAGFDNPNTFGAGAITQTSAATQTVTGAGFDNPNTFGTGAVTTGAATITGVGFDNPNTFGAGSMAGGTINRGVSVRIGGTWYLTTPYVNVPQEQRGTEAGDVRVTEAGDVRIPDGSPAWVEATEAWVFEGGAWRNIQKAT
ncbi:hypothetical protein BD1_20 [Octadecabacter Antarctic BD virus 1]|nr:hypothetical protein BD1_20 [Octadecabacter Antarctic BD virus 1]